MSQEHRDKLAAAQKAYVASDPRWAAHRAKLADAVRKPDTRERLAESMKRYMENDPRWPEHRERMQEAALRVTRLTLLPEEVEQIKAARKKGRTLEYLSAEMCIDRRVMCREMKAHGLSTAPVRAIPRARRGRGFWRSFD